MVGLVGSRLMAEPLINSGSSSLEEPTELVVIYGPVAAESFPKRQSVQAPPQQGNSRTKGFTAPMTIPLALIEFV
jgi:hypothetical protein